MRCVSSRQVRALTRGGEPAMQGRVHRLVCHPSLSNSTYTPYRRQVYGLRSRVWTVQECGQTPAPAESPHLQWRYEESDPQSSPQRSSPYRRSLYRAGGVPAGGGACFTCLGSYLGAPLGSGLGAPLGSWLSTASAEAAPQPAAAERAYSASASAVYLYSAGCAYRSFSAGADASGVL